MVAKVMIVEDNVSIFSTYQSVLSKDENVKVVGYANDGEKAIKMYQELNPDILLLDLGLPTKNGLEVINELSEYEEQKKKCNIIVISGDLSLRQNLLNTKKVFRIIPKPISDDCLTNSVNELRAEIDIENFPEKLLEDTLIELKINPLTKNGRIMTDLIRLLFYNLDLLDNLSVCYTRIAFRHSCSNKKIQSRVRTCIDNVNKNTSKDIYSKIFYMYSDDYYSIITPKLFMSGIVAFLKSKNRIQ